MTLSRLLPIFILLASASSLAFALTSQFLFDKDPCILCLYQRVPFAVTGLLAILALRLNKSSSLISLIVIACGLIYLSGAGIAIYHVGVEQHWWISGCTGSIAEDVTLDQLRASLMQKPEKACDDVDWTLFGISMATYNVFFSSLLGLVTLGAGLQMSKTRKREMVSD
ncbi:MAG: disulfide bond formation protein B [Rhodospirillales bacterium]|nr:disulfide bond formation protein B [Rhodospirillales bacterium]